MQIRSMQATFGKLVNQTLTLKPGLNVLYAPNETGKSTWVAFLTDMLYGLSTKNRGIMADKNRYAPWSAQPMQGRLEITAGGQDYTVVRRTIRANAPMGDFSCTFSGTATDVPGIDKGNLGETLLGVPREVFERSALVRQLGLGVDQDAELERRIASLITTGEEETSFTQTYNTLKAQLNSRKHNKTGQIPVLEGDLFQLEHDIAQLQALTEQEAACRSELSSEQARRHTLEQQQQLWEQAALYQQAQAYRAAQENVHQCRQREALLCEQATGLPGSETLAQCAGQVRVLQETAAALKAAQETAAEKDAAAERAKAALDALGQESSLKAPSPLLPIVGCILGMVATIFTSFYWPGDLLIGLAVLFLLVGVTLIPYLRSRNRYRSAQAAAQQQATARREAVQKAYEAARSESLHADATADALAQSYQAGLSRILQVVRQFQDSANDLSGAQVALSTAMQQMQTLNDARARVREAQLRLELLKPVQAEKPSQTPALSQEDTMLRLAQSCANEKLLQSRSDSLLGQIRSLGNLAEMENVAEQKREALASAQREYNAITLAMEALNAANLTLQNRFSPQLGAKAAEFFARLTDGKYQKVLLSRDFSLAAEASGDPARRDIQLLSQGAADQLYLAVRLAICDLVLPQDAAVPLILDDALLSFDEARCQAALELLVQEGERRQILLFTCQKRERDYLGNRAAIQTLS